MLQVLICSLIIVVVMLVMVIYISPIIGLLCLCLVLIIGKKATSFFNQGLLAYDKLTQSIQENVSASRVIKAYVKEEQETEHFIRGSQQVYSLFVKAEKVMILASPVLSTAMSTYPIVVWLGSQFIMEQKITTGDFIILFTYTTNLLTDCF